MDFREESDYAGYFGCLWSFFGGICSFDKQWSHRTGGIMDAALGGGLCVCNSQEEEIKSMNMRALTTLYMNGRISYEKNNHL